MRKEDVDEALRRDLEALELVMPVIEGSGSRTTTIEVPMLRRLYDAAKKSEVEAAARKLVAEMVRQDVDFDDVASLSEPVAHAMHGLGMAVDPEKFRPIPTAMEEIAARWKVPMDRLLELSRGPHDQDGWPTDPATGETITLTEGEHWAVQEIADLEQHSAEEASRA